MVLGSLCSPKYTMDMKDEWFECSVLSGLRFALRYILYMLSRIEMLITHIC
jgi:hypothetical protein